MIDQNRIFDTRVDTKKIFVSMKTKFVRRNYINKEGLSPVYLNITGSGERERIMLDVYVDPKKWNPKTSRIHEENPHDKDVNLILDNIEAKITHIKTIYRLSEKYLSIDRFIEEFRNEIPRIEFIGFFANMLKKDRYLLEPGTFRRYSSVCAKLRKFKKQIYFTDIDHNFIHNYKVWCKKKGNNNNTITGNLKVIKKYLKKATKHGIKMPIDIDDIKTGNFYSNRVNLNAKEINKLYLFYDSEFINPYQKLVLGYFLFSCFTGLRISDVQKLEREALLEGAYSIITKKSKKKKTIILNNKAKDIILSNKELFIKRIPDPCMNKELKKIGSFLGIRKHISFHVARHSFATNFLKMGGDVTKLQILLGHSNIRETMIYVHIVEEEINEDVFLLDNLIQ